MLLLHVKQDIGVGEFSQAQFALDTRRAASRSVVTISSRQAQFPRLYVQACLLRLVGNFLPKIGCIVARMSLKTQFREQ